MLTRVFAPNISSTLETAGKQMIESQPLGRREIGISLVLLTLLAFLVRLPLIGEAPMMDELYHLFAAKSWLAKGELAIATASIPEPPATPS